MPLTPEQTQECLRLKQLFREKSDISQRAFVKKYNLGTPANLSQYLQGRRALNIKIASVVAKALGVEVADFSPRLAREIAQIKSDQVVPSPTSGLKPVPLVSFTPASPFKDSGQLAHPNTYIETGDYVLVSEEYSDGTFATTLEGRSMEPDFLDGDILIIDPTLSPLPGDFVVAERQSPYTDGAEWTFKKYRPRGINEFGQEVYELTPLNPDFPILRSDREQCYVIGVMIEHRRRYRRR